MADQPPQAPSRPVLPVVNVYAPVDGDAVIAEGQVDSGRFSDAHQKPFWCE